MIIMMVILSGKNPKLSLFNDMVVGVFGALVAIYFCAECCKKLTGSVFNTNLGLANVTFCAVAHNTSVVLPYLPAYIFGPYTGATLAGLYIKFFAVKCVKDDNTS